MSAIEQGSQSQERLLSLLSTALGPHVAELLSDPLVTEIRVNSDGKLWQSKLGVGKGYTGHSVPPDKARQAIYAVAFSVGATCNEEHPSLAAEVPGSGERFQGVLPPLVKSPAITIRKRAKKIFSLTDFVNQGVINEQVKHLLEQTVQSRQNILIVGGTDSGKTTFANALLDIVAQTSDRIVIMEDTQELQCNAKDVEYLRTKEGVATLRDLVRVTMRLSPDRIIIGEVRGAEALDLLKAWNTGHSGGLSTVHASSAVKGLSRLEQLVQEAGVSHSKALIAEAVNILVYMEKVGTKRLVREIYKVEGLRSGEYALTSLFEGSL